jgi:ABC-type Fe3+/spermidine/putrescine transport system ATPase subunit
VANFVGTMNKLEGTVVSLEDRVVRCGPLLLQVPDPTFNHPAGEKVELFLRPEDISIGLLSNGDKPAPGLFEGRVTSLTFLGPVTRVGLETEIGPLMADVSSAVALGLTADTVVAVKLDSTSLRSIAR